MKNFFAIKKAEAAGIQDAFTNSNLSDAATTAGYATTNSPDLLTRIGSIINVGLGLVGIIFLVILISGGFLWMTAGGSADKTKKAKDMISRAIIGTVIVLLAYAITYFVISLIRK
ncbi:MAG TPA: hypothetical protein PKN62_02395 [bacterium]|nr:hypothetical protein [bacterium]